jgi:hypothetical protein
VRISGKEVQEVGFDKINQQLSILSELRIVLLDGLLVSQPVDKETESQWASYNEDQKIYRSVVSAETTKTCPKIFELDLSRNLFEKLDEVALICHGLPRLSALRLE